MPRRIQRVTTGTGATAQVKIRVITDPAIETATAMLTHGHGIAIQKQLALARPTTGGNAQAEVAGRLLKRIGSAGNKNATAAFEATLLRRWLEMETGAVKGISGAALIRKLRARVTKKK